MTITIREALMLPDMVQSKLVAGAAGVDNQIRWVTIVEVLEDTNRLQEGEFLITTGFGLMDDAKRLSGFIPSLARRGLSGVAIHTGFYLGEIPDSLITAADAYGLPLIEIPVEVNFSTITKAILQPIINRQFETLAYSQAIHEQIIRVALAGKGLPAIANELARLTDGRAVIVDTFGYQLVASQQRADTAHGIKEPTQTTERDPGSITRDQEIDAEVPLAAAELKTGQAISAGEDGQEAVTHSVPIQTATETYGFFSLTKPHAEWQELDHIALQHAATLCALEFVKERAIRETEWRMQGDFAEEILSGTVTWSAEEDARSRLLGYPLTGSHIVAALRPQSGATEKTGQHHHQLTTLLNRLAIRHRTPYLLRERPSHLLLIMPDQAASLALLERLARRWTALSPATPLYIGVSRGRQNLPDLAEAADEAVFVLHAYPLLAQPPQPLLYEQMEGYQVLFPFHRKPETLQQLWQPLLQPLLEYDRRYNQQLLETLRVYLMHNGNGLQTSQALYIHRHTLKYRIQQIESKTGIDLQHAGQRWQLQLALMAYRLHGLLYPAADKSGTPGTG
ncbi:PucR family transcriptional regulator ligand-binding domain-containing protein [Brevibacillus humidisoli]|uniref:PucR family transcriptional regulator n=1 Tax=Brevibacillus humidisoli TaxID=2895522 RepID=UPI001E36C25A|nr:PucR family transcriptional regulator [Brevibacillus humidisoli]UFJ43114.1 PucR family transcriptional regulator ligand-binding domain-containing protein [Brevibacillus humidisoli]